LQFQQALARESAGDWAGALSLVQQVAAVKLTPQVRFHVGLCEERLGKLSAALGDYQLAAVEAQDAKASEVAAQVAARTEELRARIPKLVISRGKGADYAAISLDGVSLGSSSVGTELPVDPGPHNVEAQARGFKPFNTTIDLAEKDLKKIEVTLEANPQSATTAAPGGEEGTTAAPVAEAESPKSPLPFIIGGVGVASLAASGIFFVLRANAIKTLDEKCGPDRSRCPPDQQSTYNDGKTYNVVADVTLAAGVVGVGVGVVLFLTRKKKAPTASASIDIAPLLPVGAHEPTGAALQGTF
jgi:hypothetical protein